MNVDFFGCCLFSTLSTLLKFAFWQFDIYRIFTFTKHFDFCEKYFVKIKNLIVLKIHFMEFRALSTFYFFEFFTFIGFHIMSTFWIFTSIVQIKTSLLFKAHFDCYRSKFLWIFNVSKIICVVQIKRPTLLNIGFFVFYRI